MSVTVLALAKSFVEYRISAIEFADAYMEIWKFERDSNVCLEDNDLLSETLSSIFCLADLFNPNDDREEYEVSEQQLRIRISEILNDLD